MTAVPAPELLTVTWQELVLGLVTERAHADGTLTAAVPPVFWNDASPPGAYPVTVAVQTAVLPTVTVDGAQPTAMLLVACVTAGEVVPELPRLPASPPYDACIVGLPTPLPLTVTEQAPDDSGQDAGVNETLPDPPVVDQVTVPVGELPATVAVHVVLVPMANDEGVHATAVVVATGAANAGWAEATRQNATRGIATARATGPYLIRVSFPQVPRQDRLTRTLSSSV